MHNRRLFSHAAVIGANFIWGLYATVCKDFLISGQMTGWALCGLKMIGGALLFWALSMVLPASIAPREHIPPRDMLKIFMASMLINAGSQSCIILGLCYTSPIDGTVICSMAPIFTALLAALLLRVRMGLGKIMGITIGFAGALLFVFPGILSGQLAIDGIGAGNNPPLGNTLIILSQIFGALYLLLFTDVLSKYSAVTLIKWMFLFSAIVLIPFTAPDIMQTDWASMPLGFWMQLGYIELFATGVAYFLLIIGQKGVSPTAIAMYNYVQPIVATVSAIAVGVATLSTATCIATILCLGGVYMVIRK